MNDRFPARIVAALSLLALSVGCTGPSSEADVHLGSLPEGEPSTLEYPLSSSQLDALAPGFYNGSALPPKVAYLTIDDGPSEWTEQFLNTLSCSAPSGHCAKATFFINAVNLKENGLQGYEPTLARMLRDGHALGNHTIHHVDMGASSDETIAWELDHNQTLVNQALLSQNMDPYPLTLIRPPFGSPFFDGTTTRPARIGRVLSLRGVTVLWNSSTGDTGDGAGIPGWANGEWYRSYHYVKNASGQWVKRPSTQSDPEIVGGRAYWYDPTNVSFVDKVNALVGHVLGDAHVQRGDGVMVLMHDTHPTTRDALPAIIEGLRHRGYTFETVEDYVVRMRGVPSRSLTPACRRDVTSSSLCGPLQVFWDANGGLPVFGYPKTESTPALNADMNHSMVSQWFERTRLELHPENDPPYNVLLGRLGAERLTQLGVNWNDPNTAVPDPAMAGAFQPEPGPLAGCKWFPVTRHNVCDQQAGLGFLTYWTEHGLVQGGALTGESASVALFGYPLSRPHPMTIQTAAGPRTIQVQWFERARFEWHSYQQEDRYKVLLGLLGNEIAGL